MARIEVPIVVNNSATGLPVDGAAVSITRRSNGSAVTWWPSETGGVGSTSAVITDSNGRVDAWVERGAYNAQISGTGITTYTEAFDATPGADQTVDTPWLATNVLPSGIILPYGGPASPTGWLICDGAAVSRTLYSVLFTAIGTTFGDGDGSTTFNLPDTRGRSLFGKGTHSEVNSVGDNDGVTVGARRARHFHTWGDADEAMRQGGSLGEVNSSDKAARMTGGTVTGGVLGTQWIGNIGRKDGGSPDDGPAFLVVNHIIKT